jgi:raffinose/stachyose/melibiose transport system permease protein
MYNKKKYLIVPLLLPLLLVTAFFIFYPAVINVYNGAFVFRHKLDDNPIFVGLKNVTDLLADKVFWTALKNTGILVVLVIFVQVGLALILALLVDNINKKYAAFLRIIYFMPIVISATAIGTMYLLLIQPTGLFTKLVFKDVFYWLPTNNSRALFVVMAPILWQYIGFYFVILLTGLSTIPEEYKEAALIDGASKMQVIRHITIPMLWNVLRTCMVLAITGALKVFDLPHTIAVHGAPAQQTVFMGTYNYYLYSATRLGQSAVYSVFIVLIGVLVSLLSNAVLRENKDI